MYFIKELLEIDNSRTPSEKLDCMTETTKIMTNVLQLTANKDNPAGADETLPIFIYILLKAAPQRLYSNIK